MLRNLKKFSFQKHIIAFNGGLIIFFCLSKGKKTTADTLKNDTFFRSLLNAVPIRVWLKSYILKNY